MGLSDGVVKVKIEIAEKYYYENISVLCGVTVSGEKELISLILSLTEEKNEYEKIKDAFSSVQQKGYGVVMPQLSPNGGACAYSPWKQVWCKNEGHFTVNTYDKG